MAQGEGSFAASASTRRNSEQFLRSTPQSKIESTRRARPRPQSLLILKSYNHQHQDPEMDLDAFTSRRQRQRAQSMEKPLPSEQKVSAWKSASLWPKGRGRNASPSKPSRKPQISAPIDPRKAVHPQANPSQTENQTFERMDRVEPAVAPESILKKSRTQDYRMGVKSAVIAPTDADLLPASTATQDFYPGLKVSHPQGYQSTVEFEQNSGEERVHPGHRIPIDTHPTWTAHEPAKKEHGLKHKRSTTITTPRKSFGDLENTTEKKQGLPRSASAFSFARALGNAFTFGSNKNKTTTTETKRDTKEEDIQRPSTRDDKKGRQRAMHALWSHSPDDDTPRRPHTAGNPRTGTISDDDAYAEINKRPQLQKLLLGEKFEDKGRPPRDEATYYPVEASPLKSRRSLHNVREEKGQSLRASYMSGMRSALDVRHNYPLHHDHMDYNDTTAREPPLAPPPAPSTERSSLLNRMQKPTANERARRTHARLTEDLPFYERIQRTPIGESDQPTVFGPRQDTRHNAPSNTLLHPDLFHSTRRAPAPPAVGPNFQEQMHYGPFDEPTQSRPFHGSMYHGRFTEPKTLQPIYDSMQQGPFDETRYRFAENSEQCLDLSYDDHYRKQRHEQAMQTRTPPKQTSHGRTARGTTPPVRGTRAIVAQRGRTHKATADPADGALDEDVSGLHQHSSRTGFAAPPSWYKAGFDNAKEASEAGHKSSNNWPLSNTVEQQDQPAALRASELLRNQVSQNNAALMQHYEPSGQSSRGPYIYLMDTHLALESPTELRLGTNDNAIDNATAADPTRDSNYGSHQNSNLDNSNHNEHGSTAHGLNRPPTPICTFPSHADGNESQHQATETAGSSRNNPSTPTRDEGRLRRGLGNRPLSMPLAVQTSPFSFELDNFNSPGRSTARQVEFPKYGEFVRQPVAPPNVPGLMVPPTLDPDQGQNNNNARSQEQESNHVSDNEWHGGQDYYGIGL